MWSSHCDLWWLFSSELLIYHNLDQHYCGCWCSTFWTLGHDCGNWIITFWTVGHGCGHWCCTFWTFPLLLVTNATSSADNRFHIVTSLSSLFICLGFSSTQVKRKQLNLPSSNKHDPVLYQSRTHTELVSHKLTIIAWEILHKCFQCSFFREEHTTASFLGGKHI